MSQLDLEMKPTEGAEAPAGALSRKKLEDHLWAAADILRGTIDSADYKHFIFGFLFLKRISDRFIEKARALEKDGVHRDDAYGDPDYHAIYVPQDARWETLEKVGVGVGEALNIACSAVEDHNGPAVQGVLRGIDFNDAQKLGDSKQRDALLSALIAHFAELDLSNRALSEPDMLGRAYEYLIERFADDAGKKGGEFYTPHQVVRLVVELLDPREGMRICDPTCGSGGMLIQSAQYVAEQAGKRLGFDALDLTLEGQEKNQGTWAICKMNLLLHDIHDFRLEQGDTIRQPKLLEDGALRLYHRVIANPPFSLKSWGQKEAKADGFKRFDWGVPARNVGDFAFVQHMVAALTDDGLAGVVMPHGVLFRGSGDKRIRKAMIDRGLFEAVIGLPENLFFGTGIPAVVLLLRRTARPSREGRVLFVHAAEGFESKTGQNVLRRDDIDRIVDVWRDWRDIDRFSRVVERDEIVENDYNLNIARYVDTLEPEQPADVAALLKDVRAAEKQRDAAVAELDRLLAELGFES